ncbi:MAG: hypothetical protein PF572_00920 [Patescibacteria group bacterium]|jgi:thymidylate kinase|nr:hypothetical protein [Patescibacteria group bacterium]
MKKHLIFEGAELSGKSWIMSQVYEYLEKDANTSNNILNGCHWFNCDNGVFGSDKGAAVLEHYIEIFKELNNKNIILEKFHISDLIYNRLYNKEEKNYQKIENELKNLNFKIVFIKFPEKIEVIEKRIQDRLNLYPHYEKILKSPQWYISQQKEYEKEIRRSTLDKIVVNTDKLPDCGIVEDIKKWINI